MKLGILCTMINGFGRRGYYNSQEIGLARAFIRAGHVCDIVYYNASSPSYDQVVETPGSDTPVTIHWRKMRSFPAWAT